MSPASKKDACRKLRVADLKEDDFVVIQPPAHKRRVLTEHQKEVLRDKSTIPALYSSIDASQDVSLMAHFTTDTQLS